MKDKQAIKEIRNVFKDYGLRVTAMQALTILNAMHKVLK